MTLGAREKESEMVMWREDTRPLDDPTISSVAIHADDAILESSGYTLWIKHVTYWGSYGPAKGFMASLASIGTLSNGTVEKGDKELSYLRAVYQGVVLLREQIRKDEVEAVKRRMLLRERESA